MDLKEIKRLTAYARKAGIKSLKMGDFEMTFHESALISKPVKRLKSVAVSEVEPVREGEITLAQINDYIYGNTEEAV